MKIAVIGIGSNSVRMLVSEVDGQTGKRMFRERAGTRLFAGLDAQRCLQPSAMEHTSDAVKAMVESARNHGVEDIQLFATSATRDAVNNGVFSQMLLEKTGLALQICSGNEEALLSFLGAAGGGYSGVIDIGGGSTEIVCGDGNAFSCSVSCQMGAVRLYRMMPIADEQDMYKVTELARQILKQNLDSAQSFALPDRWTGTGGTFTTLAAMALNVPWTDRTKVHGTKLERSWVESEAAMLARMSMEQRLQLKGLQPNRADIIVHGICILIACMHYFGIDEIRVSEYGNLDGFTQKHYGLTEFR